jgi:hypothetical protein
MAVGTSHNALDLVPFTALPYLTVNSRTASPAFPRKDFIAVSADYLGSEWVAFRPVGIREMPNMIKVKRGISTSPLFPYCKSVGLGFVRLPFAGTPEYAHGVISASAKKFSL